MRKEDKKEGEKEQPFGIFDAFWDIMSNHFDMDPCALGEKTCLTSVEIREMLRDVLDINVNDITLIMLKRGFRVSIIAGTACWQLTKKK